jgi:hypothetical protein
MIKVFDSAIDDTTAIELWNKYRRFRFSYYWAGNVKSSLNHWHHGIADGGLNGVDDVSHKFYNKPGYELESRVWDVIKSDIITEPCKLLRCYVNAYTFGTEGAMHTDSNREGEYTVMLYLNREWQMNWAGETVILDAEGKDIQQSVIPRFRRIVKFPCNQLHAARPVSKTCNELREVLVYKIRLDSAPDIIEEKYTALLNQIGADKTQHSKGTLKSHLMGTYQILQNKKQNIDVCLAGLFHSVYGTSIFTYSSTSDRDAVRAVIGETAERLVWLFCNLDRPACWSVQGNVLPTKDGSTITVTDLEREQLAQIEAANLEDQR